MEKKIAKLDFNGRRKTFRPILTEREMSRKLELKSLQEKKKKLPIVY